MMADYQGSPTFLVTPPMLDSLEAQITGNVEANLKAWFENNSLSFLDSAITSLYDAINVMRGWPMSKEQTNRSLYGQMQAITKEALSIPSELQQSIVQTKSSLQASLDEVVAQAEAMQATFNAQFAKLQGDVIQTQSSVETVEDKVTDIESEIKRVSATQTTEYNKSEAARGQKFTQFVDDRRSDFDAAVKAALDNNADVIRNQEKNAQDIIVRLDEVKADAEKIVGAIAGKTTAAWYQNYANEQKEVADTWRKYSAWILVGGAIVTLFWFIVTAWDGETLEEALVKIVVSISLILAAGYCSKQSDHHRNQEVQARSVELKLQALDPFMATVNPTDRERMKLATAFDVFLDTEVEKKKQPLPPLSEIRSQNVPQVSADDSVDAENA